MFRTITSPLSEAPSSKLYNALECSCRRVQLLRGCTSRWFIYTRQGDFVKWRQTEGRRTWPILMYCPVIRRKENNEKLHLLWLEFWTIFVHPPYKYWKFSTASLSLWTDKEFAVSLRNVVEEGLPHDNIWAAGKIYFPSQTSLSCVQFLTLFLSLTALSYFFYVI